MAIAVEAGLPWWTFLRRALVLCCYPVVMLIGGNIILLGNPAGRETLEAFDEYGSGIGRLLGESGYRIFIMALVYWAVAAWYCSRVLLTRTYRYNTLGTCSSSRFEQLVRIWLPRILGLLSVLPIVIYFWQREPGDLWIAPAVLVAAFIAFVVWRRPIVRYLSGNRYLMSAPDAQFAATSRGTFITLCLMFLLSILILVAVWLFGEQDSRTIGAPALVLFALGSWTLFGSIVLVHVPKSFGWPSLALLPLPLFFFFSPINENHFVAQPGDIKKLVARRGLVDDFQRWQAARDKHDGEPIYLVAAAGGASRAAYWTGLILSQLEMTARECGGRFSENIYAMSGVSGGSLGISAFAGSLLDTQPYDKVRPRLIHYLEEDFLSPVVGYSLYPDLIARLLPFPCLTCDRSRALEGPWHRDWDRNMPGARGWFAQDLLQLNQTRDHNLRIPNLFLNSTSVSNGRRVVQSNLDFVPNQAYDIYDPLLDTASLSMTGAVHDSARFPYVSPGGLVRTRHGKVWDYLVDGGYFENSGAATLSAMIDELVEHAHVSRNRFRVLIIENDPAVASQWLCRSKPANGRTAAASNLGAMSAVSPEVGDKDRVGITWPELFIPPITFFSVRTARAYAAEDELIRKLNDCSQVFELRYPAIGDAKSPPLSWFLNKLSRETMENVLSAANQSLSSTVASATGGSPNEAELAFRRNWAAAASIVSTGDGKSATGAICPAHPAEPAARQAKASSTLAVE